MKENKQFDLRIAGIGLHICSQIPLGIEPETEKYCSEHTESDCTVSVLFDRALPQTEGEPNGRDDLFGYYSFGDKLYKKALPGVDGSVSVAVYSSALDSVELYINETIFPNVVRTVGKVIQLLPMMQLLAKFNGWLLHSSRIFFGGKAIVFTAPSQTGKTTQAKLWERYQNAKIVSNDRTILRQQNDTFYTYGYPVDGSSPVYSNECIPLGAIVVLRQDKENCIERLTASQAIKYLMGQSVFDRWEKQKMIQMQFQMLDLVTKYPVYLLKCRPNEDSVLYLKKQLLQDEVLSNGSDS